MIKRKSQNVMGNSIEYLEVGQLIALGNLYIIVSSFLKERHIRNKQGDTRPWDL